MKGRRQYGGEDTAMYYWYLDAGKTVKHWPDAVVYHHISEHRMTWRYALQRSFDRGVSEVFMDPEQSARNGFGVPLFAIRQAVEAVVRLAVAMLRDHGQLCRRTLVLAGAAGGVWGYLVLRRRGRGA